MSKRVRVLIVDDSAFMRVTIAKYLRTDPEISVVGHARDGLEALERITALVPDVVTLDVEMPRMDGLTALKRIMIECPTPVVMLSSLTREGADVTIRALMRGASDFILKPQPGDDTDAFARELVLKVRTAAGSRPEAAAEPKSAGTPAQRPAQRVSHSAMPRLFQMGDPLVVIGASTGGPRALNTVLSGLPGDLGAAVAVVQHMPPAFTPSLARRLNENSPLMVQEAADGDRLGKGLALLAPGDYHLRLGRRQVSLDQGAPRQHVRPSVDVTLETAADIHDGHVIAVVLTGMGRDGTEGAARVKACGGRVIVQDEATCAVYGMPQSIAEAGLADWNLPLPEIAAKIVELVG